MKKEFIKKIIQSGGILDTAKYRYKADADGKIRRANIADVGTTAIFQPDAWKIVCDYSPLVFGAK